MGITFLYALIIFVLGLVLGSFFNVCIYRIPKDMSIAFPASHCTSCGHSLSSLDLIPVFSYIFLKGKCRYCKASVSIRYPIVELLSGTLFLLGYLKFGLSVNLAFNLIFLSLLILVTFIDIDHRIIPDRFIVVGLILGLLYLVFPVIPQISSGGDWGQAFLSLPWGQAILGGVVGGGSLFLVDLLGRLIFKKESMGFGDVKFMFMAGFFLGFINVIVALLMAIWIGAIVGVILLRVRKNSEDHYMPFGPFLSLGCVISLFCGKELVSFYLSLF